MVVVFWWIIPILILLAAGVFAIAWVRRREPKGSTLFVANSEYLESLPAYRRHLLRSRLLQSGIVVSLVVATLATTLLAGRIARERVYSPEFANRDIVLCLDVSGSMTDYDKEIVGKFSELVKSFRGERISLTIFNSTARTVFPLTDDYDLVEQQLKDSERILSFDLLGYSYGTKNYSKQQVDEYKRYMDGTLGVRGQASLIPDGLAACGLQFTAEQGRARSIIFATDNEVNGDPIYTLPEAAALVAKKDIKLFSFYPGSYNCPFTCGRELETTTKKDGGSFYESSDPNALPTIIEQIEQQQAQELGAAPRVIQTDLPLTMFVFSFIGIAGLLFMAWRLEK